MCGCACMHACVRACTRAFVRASVRARVRVRAPCVRACLCTYVFVNACVHPCVPCTCVRACPAPAPFTLCDFAASRDHGRAPRRASYTPASDSRLSCFITNIALSTRQFILQPTDRGVGKPPPKKATVMQTCISDHTEDGPEVGRHAGAIGRRVGQPRLRLQGLALMMSHPHREREGGRGQDHVIEDREASIHATQTEAQ